MPYVTVTDEMRRKMGLRFNPKRGSHLPVLMKAVALTEGPILELGCGLYSTTPLHWACHVPKRKLVTYEGNPEFFDFLKAYETEWHEVHCIDDWDAIDISHPWSVAFVDHAPDGRRWQEVKRLLHAEYVVAHDSEGRNDRKYQFSKITPLFKYQFEYKGAFPHTSVWSNLHDVTDFLGENGQH
jgi:hypothetical protein